VVLLITSYKRVYVKGVWESQMQRQRRRSQFPSRPEGSNANVTSAVGMEETVGHLRARKKSLFTHTVLWVTGLVCLAFLLAALAQAWSNSHLVQQVQTEQQHLQQLQQQHDRLGKQATYYKDPTVLENEARQQLGYIRPGEQPVVVVSGNDQAQVKKTQNVPVSRHQGFWQDWWQAFFGD
jgi:cell division protein FtsB